MSSSTPPTFVLKDINVPVTVLDAQGLTEDELTNWEPFQVHPALSLLLPLVRKPKNP